MTKTLESLPADATHWSTRSMAKASGMSRGTIIRTWRAFALQPHRTETFKLAAEPLFCIDGKSQMQALDRSLARASDRRT